MKHDMDSKVISEQNIARAKEIANKIATDGMLRQGSSVETIAMALQEAEERGRVGSLYRTKLEWSETQLRLSREALSILSEVLKKIAGMAEDALKKVVILE